MVKRFYLVLLILLLFKPIYSQRNYAVPFLTVQPSPLFLGSGQIGTAIPIKDAAGFYYNPAQLGYFSRENNLSISIMPNKANSKENNCFSMQSYGMSAGYNFRNGDTHLPLSIGIGYMHNKLDYDDIAYAGYVSAFRNSNGTVTVDSYDSYNSFDCFSIGVSYEYYLLFNMGASIKSFSSTYYLSPEVKSTAFDFGIMIIAPVSKLFFDDAKINVNNSSFIKPKVDLSIGYSLTNVGSKVNYSTGNYYVVFGDNIHYYSQTQSDPIPRTSRFGYSGDFAMELFTKAVKINLIDYSFTAEAENSLIKNGVPLEYKNIFGDIKIGKNLIQLKHDNDVIVHKGHILRLFETLIFTSGRYNLYSYADVKSKGLGLSTEGLFKILNSTMDNSIINYIAEHFVLEYYNAKTFIDSNYETNLNNLVLNYRGICF